VQQTSSQGNYCDERVYRLRGHRYDPAGPKRVVGGRGVGHTPDPCQFSHFLWHLLQPSEYARGDPLVTSRKGHHDGEPICHHAALGGTICHVAPPPSVEGGPGTFCLVFCPRSRGKKCMHIVVCIVPCLKDERPTRERSPMVLLYHACPQRLHQGTSQTRARPQSGCKRQATHAQCPRAAVQPRSSLLTAPPALAAARHGLRVSLGYTTGTSKPASASYDTNNRRSISIELCTDHCYETVVPSEDSLSAMSVPVARKSAVRITRAARAI
jgi:hypothetical protein